MLYIERCKDGVRGWIPNNTTREIESDHVRYIYIYILTKNFGASERIYKMSYSKPTDKFLIKRSS